MPNCIPTSATPDSTLSSQHDVHTACARGYEFGQVAPLVTMRAWPVARSIFDAPLGACERACERSERADNKLDNPLVASRNCKGERRERSASEMQSSWLDKILTFLRMKNKCDHSVTI